MRLRKTFTLLLAILTAFGVQLPAQATTPATITAVSGWDGEVGPNTRIFVSLHFSEPVDVVGVPKVLFNLGGQDREAEFYRYRAGSDQILDFAYVITRSDTDGTVVANSVDLDGGSITTTSNSVAADLALPVGANIEDFSDPSIDTVGPVLVDAYVDRDMVVFEWDEPLKDNWGSLVWRYTKNGTAGNFTGFGYGVGTEYFEVYPGRNRDGGQNQRFLRLDAPVAAGDEVVIELNGDPLMAMDIYYTLTSNTLERVPLRNVTPVSSAGTLGYETTLWDGDCAAEANPEFIGKVAGELFFAARGVGSFSICRVNSVTGAEGTLLPIALRTSNSYPGSAITHEGAVWVHSEDIENGLAPALTRLDIDTGVTEDFVISGLPSESACLDIHGTGTTIWVYCISGTTDSVVVFDTSTETFGSVIDLGAHFATMAGLGVEFSYETSTHLYLRPMEGLEPTTWGGFVFDKATEAFTYVPGLRRLTKLWNDDQTLYSIDYSALKNISRATASADASGYTTDTQVTGMGIARDVVKVGSDVYVLSTPGDTDVVGYLTKYDQDLGFKWRTALSDSGLIVDSSSESITIQAAEGRLFRVNISAPAFSLTATSSQDASVTLDFSGMDFGAEGELAVIASTNRSFSSPIRSAQESVSGDVSRSFTKTISGLQAGTTYFIAPVFERNGVSSYGPAASIRTTGTAPTPPSSGGGGAGAGAGGGAGAGAGAGGGGGGGFFPIPELPAPVLSSPIPAGAKAALVDDSGNELEVRERVVTSDGKMFHIKAGPISLVLTGSVGFDLSSEGQLKLSSGAPIELNASGYQPGSQVAGFLVPKSQLSLAGFSASNSPIELGTVTVESDGYFTFKRNIEAPAGDYLLQFSGTSSEGTPVTLALETTLAGSQSQGLKTWTKRLAGGTQAKLYAKSVIGQGKVSLRLNGKEIAWVRAVDETDPKLRVVTSGPMTGANYLVRTVNLQKGKNVLEVYVDGVRLTRTAYSRG